MGGPVENLLGSVVVDGRNQKISVSSVAGSGKVLGLYFSAHWCPPCRGFTPKLAQFYQRMKDKLEIVFISSDKDEAQWAEYFKEMPWLALPFGDRDRKNDISQRYGVRGIPTLILINSSTGETINMNARNHVEQFPDGNGFPWSS
jgi:nucleoredoxin